MVKLVRVEVVKVVSVWMLEPDIPLMLMELGRKGFVVARVVSRPLSGYEIAPLEPPSPRGPGLLLAVRNATRIYFNPGRRSLAVEGSNAGDVVAVVEQVEQVLKNVGSDPARGVLFYEVMARGLARGNKLLLGKRVRLGSVLDSELEILPSTLVLSNADPNSKHWLIFEVKPHWTSWPEDNVYYEVNMVYRHTRDRVLQAAAHVETLFTEILEELHKLMTSQV